MRSGHHSSLTPIVSKAVAKASCSVGVRSPRPSFWWRLPERGEGRVRGEAAAEVWVWLGSRLELYGVHSGE